MKFILLAFIVAISFFAISSDAHAQLSPAPDVEVQDNRCFRSIIETDDLYCSIRYDLPVQTDPDVVPVSPEEWCQYLFIQTGCTDDPPIPDNPESLEQGVVFVSYYDGCTAAGDCSSATLIDTGRIPRAGTSLAGVYVETGHTVTWQDSDVHACVESSRLLFSVQSQDCQRVIWSTESNTQADQRNDLGDFFVDQLLQLEIINAKGINFYIENNLITAEGKTVALEALNVADRILTVFRTSAAGVITGSFATATAVGALEATIQAQATPPWAGEVGSYIGGDETTGGIVLMFVLGFLAFFGILFIQQRNTPTLRGADMFMLPFAGFVTVTIFLAYTGSIDLSIPIGFGIIMSGLSVVFLYRKVFGN